MKKLYLFLSLALSYWIGFSQCSIDVGDGSDGAFNSSGNTVLNGSTFNFTSFQLNAGHTLTFNTNNPIEIHCQGSFNVDGIINVSGQDGGSTDNGLMPGPGGLAGPGGYDGGSGGGAGAYSPYDGADGNGPGAGIGGVTIDRNEGLGGGGGGYGTPGTDAIFIYDTAAFGTGYGLGGPAYGDSLLAVLEGGSGGGGGGADWDGGSPGSDDPGGGGGGGGGAIRISTPAVTISATGQILANGGNGGSTGNGGSGGGGAGGAIHIETSTLSNDGTISAVGGVSLVNQFATSEGGTGGDGRIAVTANPSGIGSITPTSTVTTVVPSSYTLVEGCNSVVFGGTTYTTSQLLIDTVVLGGGCDSLVITDIQVYTPMSYQNNYSGCDSLLLDSVMYYSSTTFSETFTAMNGCDSIIVTNITITGSSKIATLNLYSGCDSAMYMGTMYDSSFAIYDTLMGSSCDSIVVDSVVIYASTNKSKNVTITEGDSYSVGSSTYTTAGTYVDNLTSVHGCDSVITTNLTVNPVNGFNSNLSNELNIYPNPVNDLLIVESTVNLKGIIIRDLEGRIVKNISPNNLTTSISTNEFQTGMYMYEIIDTEGNTVRGKIIKQ